MPSIAVRARHRKGALREQPILLAERKPELTEVKTRCRHALALAFFVLLVGTIYLPVVIGHKSLITNGSFPGGPLYVGDPMAGGPITAPLERLAALAWQHLQLPIFDPYQGYGVSLLSNQGDAVYPLQIILESLVPHNYSLMNLVNVTSIGFGSYLLASSLKQSFIGSISVGVLAALAGPVPANVNMAMLDPLALLPFIILAFRHALDPTSKHHRSAWLGIATGVALLGLSGFPELLPIVVLALGIFVIAYILHFRTVVGQPKLVMWSIASSAVGAAIGIVGVLPTFLAVRSGSGVNGPTSYIGHVPTYWLSTLGIPSINGKAMTAQPSDLNQTVWTLGTPLLIFAIAMALALAMRRPATQSRWYVVPLAIFSIFGVLAYANVFDVLRVFAFFPFNAVFIVRFLQFAWWIPWCLLVGFIISNVKAITWQTVLAPLALSVLSDVVLAEAYKHALLTQHLASAVETASRATWIAIGILIAFATSLWVARRFNRATLIVALIVLASCAYYLPTNFFPSTAEAAVASWKIPNTNVRTGRYLLFTDTTQLPTTARSVQIYGPIIPRAYHKIITALGKSDTHGMGAFGGEPSLHFATMNRELVSVLRGLGVTTILSGVPLGTQSLGAIPRCPLSANGVAPICFLGTARQIGGPKQAQQLAYKIVGATPLVAHVSLAKAVPTTGSALRETFRSAGSPSTVFKTVYLAMRQEKISLARGIRAVTRRTSTESVAVSLRAKTAGLAILRDSYVPGMHASVNGSPSKAIPVDGGLWTAVRMAPGSDRVVLDYTTTTEIIEFAMGAFGFVALLGAWCALAVNALRRKTRARVPEAAGSLNVN